MKKISLVSPLFASAFIATSIAHASPVYLGYGSISLSNLSGLLEDGVTSQNPIDGFGSAIAYTGSANQYILFPDRGPNATAYTGGAPVDNTQSFITRFQTLQISVSQNPVTSAWNVAPSYVSTTLLSNPTPLTGSNPIGNNPNLTYFTGLSSGFNAANPTQSMRFDPEGARVSNDGTKVYVSDEYGPYIYEFDRATGVRTRAIALPEKFGIATPNGVGNTELVTNTSGRQANRGMEGLAITPDGKTLVGIMQSPLIKDGGLAPSGNPPARVGTNVRIVTIDIATGATKEFLYQLNSASLGISEILAVNDHEFIVDERDSGTSASAIKQLYKIDLTGATDISGVASLPSTGNAPGVTAVGKGLFLDLQAAVHLAGGLPAGTGLPEKIEGLAFGPDLAAGVHLLFVTNDNDFLATAGNNIYAFSFTDADLPGFQAQQFGTPVPLPAAAWLLMGGVGALGAFARRRI